MAIFNFKKREIECKIVYYGPGRCGKTTNMEYIFKTFKKQVVGEMVSIDTEGDRTLFFDFLPMGLGRIKGFDIKLQVYTVPGQVQYRSTRKLVLKGVDGIIFVADSLAVRREKNMVSLKDLQHNLKEYGLNIFKIPLVMQHNKRDLAGQGFPIMSVEQMEKDLNRQLKVPSFPASAIIGQGVGTTLKECLKLTLISFRKNLKLGR
ncbi:MAG: gliding motility protein [Deltaproteobacteria bacterium]|jgi:signal recognition particle receptor subunit beta|nr:gliding motility protein [Deltaproteobacteria bacterium]MDX2498072.1 ADP-ribosylation factor-like protein [Desulfobacterales bacterium]MBW1969266.1 gliding motility protein [Deltaproteobacteria bacterium]MBW2155418.1 gliding motility protein [Deltaproteobacteria bacterium]MBW2197638.1 gliding motility protein [Deltaproteobacteria bacterium]